MLSLRQERWALLTGSLLIVVMLGLGAYSLAHNQVMANQEVALQELTETVKGMVLRYWIEPRERTLDRLASSSLLHARIRREVDYELLAMEWKQVIDHYQDIFFIYYADAGGAIDFYPPGELPPGYDAHTRPWYQLGMSRPGQLLWSPPYEEAVTGEPVVSTVRTIDDPVSGEPLGVMAMDATLGALESILEDIAIPHGGSISLFHESGALLAWAGEAREDPVMGGEMLGESEGESGSYHPAGDGVFIFTADLPQVGWTISFTVPRATLLAELAPLRYYTVMAGVVLAGITMLFFYLASWTHKRKVAVLADYYLKAARSGQDELRELFGIDDEFHVLNREFNQALVQMRETEEKRRKGEEEYREMINTAPVGFFQTTKQGRFLGINERFAEILGYSSATAALEEIPSVEAIYADLSDRQRLVATLDAKGEVRDYQVQFQRRSGRRVWVSISARAMLDDKGDIQVIAGFADDISGQVRTKRRLEELANTDSLTKVYNRRHFEALAQEELLRAKRYGWPVALVLFDIDHFKKVNDTYGHTIGDEVLIQTAQRIMGMTRDRDIFARVGGDEFILLLPQTESDHALSVAERIRSTIAEEPFYAGGETMIQVTISLGLSVLDGALGKLDYLAEAADRALYDAKEAGRNCVRFREYSESDQ